MAGLKIQNLDGFIDYNDVATQTTPISFTGTDIKLTNDGLGAYSLKTYKPYDIEDLWNTITNQFDFSMLELGDEVSIRFSIEVTTISNNQEFSCYLDMAKGSVSNYHLKDGYYVFKTSGAKPIIFNMHFYIGNTDTKDFPAEIIFTSDANATIKVDGFYISVKRNNK